MSIPSTNNFEGFFVELNFLKKKIILCCFYNPHKINILSQLISLGETLDIQMTKYDNFLIAGDSYSELSESAMTYHLNNLVKSPTCFRNQKNSSCINLILTNCPKSFMNTKTVDTGLSDFRKLTLTVLKIHYEKPSPKIVTYIETYNCNKYIL